MTSPPYLSAISRASLDFPVPVAPHTTIKGTRWFKNLVALVKPAAAILKTWKEKCTQSTIDERLAQRPSNCPFPFVNLSLWADCYCCKNPTTTVVHYYTRKPHFLSTRSHNASRILNQSNYLCTEWSVRTPKKKGCNRVNVLFRCRLWSKIKFLVFKNIFEKNNSFWPVYVDFQFFLPILHAVSIVRAPPTGQRDQWRRVPRSSIRRIFSHCLLLFLGCFFISSLVSNSTEWRNARSCSFFSNFNSISSFQRTWRP